MNQHLHINALWEQMLALFLLQFGLSTRKLLHFQSLVSPLGELFLNIPRTPLE